MAKLCEYGDRLETMSAQEVFDAAARHLITQNKKSVLNPGDNCQYKGPDGLCCAAAPFLPEYDPKFEGFSWAHLVRHYGVTPKHMHLMAGLQDAHDSHKVSEWPRRLTWGGGIFQTVGRSRR